MAPTSPNPLALIFQRDIIGTAADAANTLSSWDNCMAQAYCKWPVIVAIILAGLIVLSVIICIARCACCGLECCCWCCSCFNRCCPSPRNAKSKYKEAPQQPPPQNYGYHPGMFYGPPQFATFDASAPKKVTEDSLPAMPSWQTAQTRRIEDDSIDEDDSAFSKEVGGSDGMAMGAVKRSHEHDQLYEDPDPPQHPYAGAASSPQTRDPYSQPLHQQNQQPQYADDNAYPYQDRNSYAYTDNSHPNQNPSYDYAQYSQQQDTYSNAPVTPSSTYTAQYPPTYHTRAPTVRSYNRGPSPGNAYPYAASPPSSSPPPFTQQPQQYQNLSPTSPTGYRGLEFAQGSRPNFSRPSPAPAALAQVPVEPPAPAPVEMPGSLVPGGGQRYYPQAAPQEMAAGRPGSASVHRKQVSGDNWR